MKILKKVCMVSALACLAFAVPVSAADVNVPASFADKTPETSNIISLASDPSGSYTLKPWETQSFYWILPASNKTLTYEANQQGVSGGIPFLNYKHYIYKNGNWELIKEYNASGNGVRSEILGSDSSTFYRLDVTNVMYYSGTTDVKLNIQFYDFQN
ncbi:hypothetical protein [Paenibacillus tyrfis]|uniref:Uncharacterized protein n=1 Tax=Paenibacillus tyrfis TaxID=1501230 RepID=A0A081P8B4_9BACL|nr:hypothetical protein [Paenibacillus tyrfis]KEQ26937.1 hypothetical protein ET33_29855 [Paenibacillus tyrfis]